MSRLWELALVLRHAKLPLTSLGVFACRIGPTGLSTIDFNMLKSDTFWETFQKAGERIYPWRLAFFLSNPFLFLWQPWQKRMILLCWYFVYLPLTAEISAICQKKVRWRHFYDGAWIGVFVRNFIPFPCDTFFAIQSVLLYIHYHIC